MEHNLFAVFVGTKANTYIQYDAGKALEERIAKYDIIPIVYCRRQLDVHTP